jgi:hypothetical protein
VDGEANVVVDEKKGGDASAEPLPRVATLLELCEL